MTELHAPTWLFMGEPGHEEAFGRPRVYDGNHPAGSDSSTRPRTSNVIGEWCLNPHCVGGSLVGGRCAWCGTGTGVL